MIEAYEKEGVFHLTANGMSVGVLAGEEGIRSLYWGGALAGTDLLALRNEWGHSSFDPAVRAERTEYDAYDGRRFTVPCLQADGGVNRYIVLNCTGFAQEEGADGSEALVLHLGGDKLDVDVRYTLYPEGILARSARLKAKTSLSLTSALSGALCLPEGQESKARYVNGRWAGEFQVNEQPVCPGVMTLQAKRGITGPHFNPAVLLGEPEAQEETGRVWSVALGYSGNWVLQVEKTSFGNTRITAGVNPFDHVLHLAAGDGYETPVLYAGYSGEGFGGMSRRWHVFLNTRIMSERKPRPVLYNSWEATAFAVEVEKQKALAERAARIGCERFVVDDGWFGARDSDHAGLGDWYVNTRKFPAGLDELISHVKSLGMDFGIWVEPEAVNPDSDLFRTHPDWIYHTEGREPMQLRYQYELNLSLPEVREYLKGFLRELLGTHDIAYVKWDMNRALTDVDILDGDARLLWEKHVEGLYELWQMVREEFPQVELETCAGGGGRIDLGILRYAHQFWTSDNTDPYDRLLIQQGCSLIYPASAMMCWVTDSGAGARKTASLAYRFHSSMCGGLGIGADITKFSEAQLAECRTWIEVYKKYRHVILGGELYRIGDPAKDRASAVEYVGPDKDEAVAFAFLHTQTLGDHIGRLRLRGLDPERRYALPSGAIYAGSTLMELGLSLELTGDYDSAMICLKAVE